MTFNYPNSSDATWGLLRKYVANQVAFFSSVYPAMTFQSPSSSDTETQLIRKMLRNQADFYAAGGGGGGTPSVPFVGVKVAKELAAQNVTSGLLTAVTWDTVFWDTDGFANLGSDNVFLTVPAGQGGTYLGSFTGQWSTNALGLRLLYMETAGSAIQYLAPMGVIALPTPQPTYCNGTVPFQLVAGDTVKVVGLQTSGTTRTIDFANGLTSLALTKLAD